MTWCPACTRENPDDARFCSNCGAPLARDSPAREERKVVTCLFCDLVGFTSRAERMDPEDVRRLLQPYHARVRSELERYGGTVEKFIGDAVMAVFGAPIAHEDDPERAVRSALAIREALAEDEQHAVRIGITTGEALVALGARPEAGEGMASGDVVNTAARLQAAAPVNGILVDETTYRATERAIAYGEPRAIEAKGKSEPIRVWEAERAHARVSVERVGGAALIGREHEVRMLRDTLARVAREREPQLVTLVGVPGIGKSRLVYELFRTVEAGERGLVYWRGGRSLPYGDGITFWALGEMIKAQAGILESDRSEQAADKLREAVARFVADPSDGAWVERHLRPLVGLEADESVGDRRDETFAAWRRFLEAIADEHPLVLVFEDLHWADDALLDFIDHLVDWATGVPLLVISTARPELLSRRPGWGGGKPNSSTLQLSPLSEAETTSLLHALLGRSMLAGDLQARLLEHAGGNPLYAEEFTRMLTSRPDEVVLPETVQGIIAARLDTLPPEEKELLQDAAVIGRTFWLGALGRERWMLEDRLHALERKGFVTRSRRSSVAGENEFVIRHALVRDVAYEQIPRAQRSDKHLKAADWIGSLGRTEDHAEMLAHHVGSALEYASGSGQVAPELAEQAVRVLVDAGDRAFSLNSFAASARYYAVPLALGVASPVERAELLFRRGRALYMAGEPDCEAALEAARVASLEAGAIERAAEADALIGEQWWFRASPERSSDHLARAYSLVQALPSSPAKAYVVSQVGRYRALAGANEDAIRISGEALAMAEELDLAELRVRSLVSIGTARTNLGDASGLEEFNRAIGIASSAHSPELARARNNLAVAVFSLGDLRRGLELMGEAVEEAKRAGTANLVRFSRNVQLWLLFRVGRWDEALPDTNEFIARCEAGAPHYHEGGMRSRRAKVRLARDDVEGALVDVQAVVRLAREAGDPQQRIQWLAESAATLAEMGDREEAQVLADEALGSDAGRWALGTVGLASAELALGAVNTGVADLLATRLEEGLQTRWAAATLAALRGELVHAADLFHEIGDAQLEALARIRAAARLAAIGDRDAAGGQLSRSLAFWRSVQATRYVRQAEAMLADIAEIPA